MKWLGRVILFLPVVVYLLFSTKQYYWDGVAFAHEIERAAGDHSALFRANHLLYNLAGYLLYTAFDAQIRALFLLQALNSILAGICILIVFRILMEITESWYHSICLALMFAFSATWWRFATDADAYIPSILFMLICYLLLLPDRRSRPVRVGVTHAMAMLFHQLAVFFYPVAIVALWRQTKRMSNILCYIAVSGLLTAGAYIYVYRTFFDAGSFWSWITTHSEDSRFTFSLFDNAVTSLLGSFRLFFGGRSSLLQLNAVTVIGIICLAVALGWIYTLRTEIKRGFRELWAQLTKQHMIAGSSLLVWIFCYMCFLLFWIPKNTFYRLFYLPAIIFLIGMLGRPWKERLQRPLAVAVIMMCVWNFTFLIYPHSRIENSVILSFALQHREDWPRGTTIIIRDFHATIWTISYFNPQVSWIWEDDTLDISALPKDRPFWLDGTAYDFLKEQPEGERWLAAHIDNSGSFIHGSRRHSIRFYRIISQKNGI